MRRGDVQEMKDILGKYGLSTARILVNALGGAGLSPLHQSALSGHEEMVALLLSYGADPHTVDMRGWQPLHVAAAGRYASVVRALLGAAADPFAQTHSGELPVDLARDDSSEVLDLLAGTSPRCSYPMLPSDDSGLATGDSDEVFEFEVDGSDADLECVRDVARSCRRTAEEARRLKGDRSSYFRHRRPQSERRVDVVVLRPGAVSRTATIVQLSETIGAAELSSESAISSSTSEVMLEEIKAKRPKPAIVSTEDFHRNLNSRSQSLSANVEATTTSGPACRGMQSLSTNRADEIFV